MDVGAYLEQNQLESHLSEVVAECVENEMPQPLGFMTEQLKIVVGQAAIDFDYRALQSGLRSLVAEKPECGPVLMRLSYQDAITYSMAHYPNGGPNAALRFSEFGEGTFAANKGLAAAATELLGPFTERFPRISLADLWAFAANVALEAMGGPTVATRFGRRDAPPQPRSEDEITKADGRLVDESALGIEKKAAYLRRIYSAKGLRDREIVALQGRHTVGECMLDGAAHSDGTWSEAPHAFDNSYFLDLLRKTYEPHGSSSGATVYKCGSSGTVMTAIDIALLGDAALRGWVETYASDSAKFKSEFAAAWTKVQELGYDASQLVMHPMSLTYASACYLPNEWLELPMITRREVNHDTTAYSFGLPRGQSLSLPVCACLLLKAPGKGRGPKGKDDWDGSDAVRPYTPVSDESVLGRFDLLVKRYDGGAVSNYLHNLPVGSRVAFRCVPSAERHCSHARTRCSHPLLLSPPRFRASLPRLASPPRFPASLPRLASPPRFPAWLQAHQVQPQGAVPV